MRTCRPGLLVLATLLGVASRRPRPYRRGAALSAAARRSRSPELRVTPFDDLIDDDEDASVAKAALRVHP